MYSLNQEKPWYLSDEWYVTVEEFDANHMYIDKSKDNKTINILKK